MDNEDNKLTYWGYGVGDASNARLPTIMGAIPARAQCLLA